MLGLISSACYHLLLRHSCAYPCAWYQYLKIDHAGKAVRASAVKHDDIVEGSPKLLYWGSSDSYRDASDALKAPV